MTHRHSLTFSALIVLLVQSWSPVFLTAATVAPFGLPLDEGITSAYVPPTRPDNPYVTTGQALYQWDDESAVWTELYSPPWATSRILQVVGYEKSSKVIYVVHSSGVARSGDAGESWIEAVPPAFDVAQGPYSLVVNPHERRHAVLASGAALWETSDFGVSYQQVDLDAELGPVLGQAFVGTSEALPRLVVTHQNGLHLYEGQPLKTVGNWKSESPLARSLVHPDQSHLYLQDMGNRWMALDFAADGSLRIIPLALTAQPAIAAASSSGTSSLWMVSGSELSLVSLSSGKPDPFSVASFPQQPTLLLPHPRVQNSLFGVTSNQLYRVEDAFDGASAVFIEALDFSGSDPLQWQRPAAPKTAMPVPQPSGIQEQPMEVAILLRKVLAEEPGFQETFRKVLEHEQSQPGAFAEWQKKARSRHLIPELRIYGGVREYGVDNNLLVSSINQFGIEETEDFRLPDRIRNLGFLGISLEWPLSQLVYDEELIDISRERRYSFKDRRRLVEDLAELYYGRINRIVEARGYLGKPSRAQSLKLLIEISQISDILNGYCGEVLFDPMPLD